MYCLHPLQPHFLTNGAKEGEKKKRLTRAAPPSETVETLETWLPEPLYVAKSPSEWRRQTVERLDKNTGGLHQLLEGWGGGLTKENQSGKQSA